MACPSVGNSFCAMAKHYKISIINPRFFNSLKQADEMLIISE